MICNNCKRDKGDVVVCPYCHVGNSKAFQPHHLPAGMIVGGRYEIRAVLGEGGFGITYSANDTKLNKRVAVSSVTVYDTEVFNYDGINRSSGIGYVTAKLGDPLSYEISTSQSIDTKDKMTDSLITLQYKSANSDIELTFSFIYDPMDNSCELIKYCMAPGQDIEI